jgi:hypothetical protein
MCAQCPRARKPRDFTPPRSKPDSRWITAGQSAIHGRGVYARELIPDGTPVIDYTGESRQLRAEGNKFLPSLGLAVVLIGLGLAAVLVAPSMNRMKSLSVTIPIMSALVLIVMGIALLL